MKEFKKHFSRDRAGSWTCMEPATLDLPAGQIQVAPGTRFTLGSIFMGVELAKLLDEQHAKERAPQPRPGS
jgi:hypothetical protein